MQLDRSVLLKAIKFLKPAISKADEEEQKHSDKIKALTHVHVRIDAGKCIMTAGDGTCGKRVHLKRPSQLVLVGKEEKTPDQEYLIPRATIEAFETLCQKHKAKFEKSAKIDHSLKLIDIFDTSLESHKNVIRYEQPIGLEYPDLDQFFFANKEPVTDIKFSSGVVIDCLKEFGCHVEISFAGQREAVYICNDGAEYEAFFMPVS
jgi:hypothetical protein